MFCSVRYGFAYLSVLSTEYPWVNLGIFDLTTMHYSSPDHTVSVSPYSDIHRCSSKDHKPLQI